VTAADVPRIVEETVIGGKILDDLRIPEHLMNSQGKPASPDSTPEPGTDGCDQ
jgi:(2Fe-2S) ferredoxin